MITFRTLAMFSAAMVGLGILSGVVLAAGMGTLAGLMWLVGAFP